MNQYRELGARARAMLIATAAQQWNVAPEQCRGVKGVVYGPQGKKLTYGALADAAMKLPVPTSVMLKDAKDFRCIGKPMQRLDARAKSTGHQQFGIDASVPGMKVALIAHPPVFGARIAKFDASKARANRVTAGVHCNRAVNPLTIEAQVQGAILMAVGTTMPGSAITLKDGVVEQQNFSDYTVARLPNMPQVEVHIVASDAAPTGMGESGLPPLAPAYANAIAKLTGKRLCSLPFDLTTA